tara:strand:- start:804 stop:1790 length:987 start_codon:yes stop_codon:yes gene_type:complete
MFLVLMPTSPKHNTTNTNLNFLWDFGNKERVGGVYEYSFNTQMHTDEISGTGNHTTALFWEYDTRLGRRWNLDPKPQVFISDYAVLGNNPILYSDVLGDTTKAGNRMRANLPGLIAAPLGGLTDAIGGVVKTVGRMIKGDKVAAKKEWRDVGVGLLGIVGLGEAFTQKWRPGATGGILPESLATDLEDVNRKVWDPSFIDHPEKNGMHAWHAGSNARLANKLGPVGSILAFIGGLYHESPFDKFSFKAEQRAQGTVNHIIDSFTDIIANIVGIATGLLLPQKWATNVGIKIGNQIPGPGDPDPTGAGTGGYKGNPGDAWGQYPKLKVP